MIRRNDSYGIPLLWGAFEGESLSLHVSDAGMESRQVLRDYWYRAPR